MSEQTIVDELLARHGVTFAEQAGITLRDKPSPLYQLLVLTLLSAARIRADVAVNAAHELFESTGRTPERMREATWQQRVDALGRGGYRRYDESTATRLQEGADLLLDEWHGDLRRIRPAEHSEVPALRSALTRFPGIGPTGADIYCREVQGVWPEVAPYFDDRALQTADELGLPTDPSELADLVDRSRLPELSTALVRMG